MQSGEIIIYQMKDGQTSLEVKLENNTIWLRQEQISQLFGRERSVISKHIANLFKEKELERETNVQILHIAFFIKLALLEYIIDMFCNHRPISAE